MKLTVVYTILAIIATLLNIGAQEIVVRSYTGAYAITASVMVGTAVGLMVKYLLDKRYIFSFKARNTIHEGQTFALYTLMGLVTTTVFWGFEFSFQHLFQSKELRYLGGIIGLAIGYFIKYQLDKRYVFREVTN